MVASIEYSGVKGVFLTSEEWSLICKELTEAKTVKQLQQGSVEEVIKIQKSKLKKLSKIIERKDRQLELLRRTS